MYIGNQISGTENHHLAHTSSNQYLLFVSAKSPTSTLPQPATSPIYPSPIDLSPTSSMQEVIMKTPKGQPKKFKRKRANFSNEQLCTLNMKYSKNKYLKTPERKILAAELGLTEMQIKNWFQNRRMKDKNCKKTLLKGSPQKEDAEIMDEKPPETDHNN